MCNFRYLATISGILKIIQLITGGAVVGLVGYFILDYLMLYSTHGGAVLGCFTVAVTFLTGTFLLLIANLFTPSYMVSISKTTYEVVYHMAATLLYGGSVVAIFNCIHKHPIKDDMHNTYLAAGVLGALNCVLYLFSAIVSVYAADEDYV